MHWSSPPTSMITGQIIDDGTQTVVREIGCFSQIIYLRFTRYHKAFAEGLVVGAMPGKKDE